MGRDAEARSGLAVRRFQITQVRRDSFQVRLVLEAPSQADLAALKQSLRETLGAAIQVEVEVVRSLDRPYRKFYPFVSYERLEKLRRQPAGREYPNAHRQISGDH